MKTLILFAKGFTFLCLITPFVIDQDETLKQEPVKEVLFWCDCGAVQHWKELPLDRV